MSRRQTVPEEERLTIRYIPLTDALEWEWEDNPKKHDYDEMIAAFREHGFKDPPIYDGKLDRFAAGNGRTRALAVAKERGEERFRGIGRRKSDGEWVLPVQFGNDAASRDAAQSFAVDHNNLTLAGSGIPRGQALKLWTREDYEKLLTAIGNGHRPTTVSEDDLEWITSDELKLPDGRDRTLPELESDHLVTIACSADALAEITPTLEEWNERDDVEIDVA